MNNTYLLIRIDGQENIGIINAGNLDVQSKNDLKNKLISVVEKKLIIALTEHFDCEIKIRSYDIKSDLPLSVVYKVVISSDDEDYEETVFVEKTWLY